MPSQEVQTSNHAQDPILTTQVLAIQQITAAGRMFQAATSLAFFGFLRVREFTAMHFHHILLSRGDIQLVGHELQILRKRSKADQWRKGTLMSIGCSRDKCFQSEQWSCTWRVPAASPTLNPVPVQAWFTADFQDRCELQYPHRRGHSSHQGWILSDKDNGAGSLVSQSLWIVRSVLPNHPTAVAEIARV